MNVDIRKTRQELECNWCHKTIEAGALRLCWARKNGAFTLKYFYHCEPDCWMEERIYYAAERARREGTSYGRPRLKISDAEREERIKATKRKWWDKNRRKV